jgi:hypothetical protein
VWSFGFSHLAEPVFNYSANPSPECKEEPAAAPGATVLTPPDEGVREISGSELA